MSDDDLRRPKEHATGDRPPEQDRSDDTDAEGSAQEPVADETQPLPGTSSPPPSAPGPSPDPGPGPGAVPPPQNPFSAQQQNPYTGGQEQGYGQPGQPGQPGQTFQPPPNPYQSPHEYAAPQNPYGVPYQPAYAGGVLPDHPSATTAMVLGIISLVGLALCGGLTLILAPAAWIVGAKSLREIDASPGRYAGRDRAQAGKVMGIIGTVLLVLGILAIIAIVVVVIAVGGSSDPGPTFPSPNAQIG